MSNACDGEDMGQHAVGGGYVPRPRTMQPARRRIVSRSYGPGEAPDPRANYFNEGGGLRQVLLWTAATRRQVDRWEALVAEAMRCHLYENQQPAGVVIWEAEAERHLAFVSARNLLRAIAVTGLPMQIDPVLSETLTSIRDLLEHWDQNMPVFNVWPHTAQPPRKSGQLFAARNPERSPYGQIAWSGDDGPILGPGLPASSVHRLLDEVEQEVIANDHHLGQYMSTRSCSPWLGESAGRDKWWPTHPTDLPPRRDPS